MELNSKYDLVQYLEALNRYMSKDSNGNGKRHGTSPRTPGHGSRETPESLHDGPIPAQFNFIGRSGLTLSEPGSQFEAISS